MRGDVSESPSIAINNREEFDRSPLILDLSGASFSTEELVDIIADSLVEQFKDREEGYSILQAEGDFYQASALNQIMGKMSMESLTENSTRRIRRFHSNESRRMNSSVSKAIVNDARLAINHMGIETVNEENLLEFIDIVSPGEYSDMAHANMRGLAEGALLVESAERNI